MFVAFSGYNHHPQRDRVHLLEPYAIFCKRLCFPIRWCDLHKECGRSTSALSRIFRLMIHLIVSRVGPKVVFYPLKQERYDQYLECFARKNADAELRIVAVIDAKKLMSCRPTHFQGSQATRTAHHRGSSTTSMVREPSLI